MWLFVLLIFIAEFHLSGQNLPPFLQRLQKTRNCKRILPKSLAEKTPQAQPSPCSGQFGMLPSSCWRRGEGPRSWCCWWCLSPCSWTTCCLLWWVRSGVWGWGANLLRVPAGSTHPVRTQQWVDLRSSPLMLENTKIAGDGRKQQEMESEACQPLLKDPRGLERKRLRASIQNKETDLEPNLALLFFLPVPFSQGPERPAGLWDSEHLFAVLPSSVCSIKIHTYYRPPTPYQKLPFLWFIPSQSFFSVGGLSVFTLTYASTFLHMPTCFLSWVKYIIYLFSYGLSHDMQKFPGQGLNLSHSSDNNAKSLITRPPGNSEIYAFLNFIFIYFYLFVFLGPRLWSIEVPRLGVKSEPQPQ